MYAILSKQWPRQKSSLVISATASSTLAAMSSHAVRFGLQPLAATDMTSKPLVERASASRMEWLPPMIRIFLTVRSSRYSLSTIGAVLRPKSKRLFSSRVKHWTIFISESGVKGWASLGDAQPQLTQECCSKELASHPGMLCLNFSVMNEPPLEFARISCVRSFWVSCRC
jgi:hypothetical protein